MQIAEFMDNDHFTSLESLIIQFNNSSPEARFKIIMNQPPDLYKQKIEELIKALEVEMHIGARKDFTAMSVQHTLNSLLKEQFNYKMQENDMDTALAALNAAIETCGLRSMQQGQFTLKKYTLEEHQRLDVAALKAMNVFPQNNETVSGKAGSLFGLLNECKTQIGNRLLKKWLKQPPTSAKEIEQRHQIVDFFYKNESTRTDL